MRYKQKEWNILLNGRPCHNCNLKCLCNGWFCSSVALLSTIPPAQIPEDNQSNNEVGVWIIISVRPQPFVLVLCRQQFIICLVCTGVLVVGFQTVQLILSCFQPMFFHKNLVVTVFCNHPWTMFIQTNNVSTIVEATRTPHNSALVLYLELWRVSYFM
jgi:hypothetical protein